MLIGDNVSYELTSFEEAHEEVKRIALLGRGDLLEISWMLYNLLPTGSVMKAEQPYDSITKCFLDCSDLESAIFEHENDNSCHFFEEKVFFPKLAMGDTIMFLGMTLAKYPHDRVITHPISLSQSNRRKGSSKVVERVQRQIPQWLIGEKVYTYPILMQHFSVAKLGTGIRAFDVVTE